MIRTIRKNARAFGALVALVLVGIAVGGFLLVNQRLRLPWEDIYTVKVELSTAQAITPGQGQTATVAGVNVGEVSKVELDDGRAIVSLAIEEERLPSVGADAQALVRPRTPLQDISVELDPGSTKGPQLEDGGVIPISRTAPQVNIEEILAGLDADTRAYLRTLINAGGQGLKGEGDRLNMVLKALGPTIADVRSVNVALAGRRTELKRVVSNLRRLSGALADQSGSAQTLVSAGSQTLGALADEDVALRRSLRELPGTLGAADRALAAVRPFAREGRTSFDALVPVAEELPGALRATRRFATRSTPGLVQLRALSREAQPLARDLGPALRDVRRLTPSLAGTFGDLRLLTNELAYNPKDRSARGADRSYLFWAMWFGHNANSMLSVQDGNGPFWRGQLITSCSSLPATATSPVIDVLREAGVCPR